MQRLSDQYPSTAVLRHTDEDFRGDFRNVLSPDPLRSDHIAVEFLNSGPGVRPQQCEVLVAAVRGTVPQTVFLARHAGLRSGGMGTVSDDIEYHESTEED
jgi:hypothetical protein